MDRRKEFIAEVRRKAAPGLPEWAVETAAEWLFEAKGGRLEFSSAGDAVVLAGRLVAAAPAPSAGITHTFLPPTEGDRITAELLCDELEPEVCALRQRLFRCEEAPFAGKPGDAVQWIEAEVGRSPKPRRRGAGAEWFTEVRAGVARLQQLTGYRVKFEGPVLSFPGQNGGAQEGVPPRAGTRLWELAEAVDRIAARGNLRPAAVTWWVLAGVRPLILRAVITEHAGMRRWVTLEINAADVTWRELWPAYRSVRKLPHIQRQRVNPLHARIFDIVRERGGIPRRGRCGFWEAIRRQLEAENRAREPKRRWRIPGTWNAIKKAYESIFASRGPRQPGRRGKSARKGTARPRA